MAALRACSVNMLRLAGSDGRIGGGIAILVRRDMSAKSIKSTSVKLFEVVTIAISRNTIIPSPYYIWRL